MIEKIDPHQKTIQDDLSDDDPIIELTEEVVLPDKDRKAQNRQSDDTISAKSAEDQAFENDEDITAFEENGNVSGHHNLFSETDHQDTGDERGGLDDSYTDALEDDGLEMVGDEDQRDFEQEMETESDVISLTDFDDDNAEIEEDIIEITEFDQHFSEDDENILAHAGMMDSSGLGDEDFLDLFELEDESPTENEKLRELSDSEEKAVEAELNLLLDDTVEDETLFENTVRKPGEELSGLNPDWSSDTSTPPAWRSDHSAGLFPEETAIDYGPPILYKDHPEDSEKPMGDSLELDKGESQPISDARIDMAIERVIKEKFADRIEEIIYETIEKTVLKEIERLKGALLEGGEFDDDI